MGEIKSSTYDLGTDLSEMNRTKALLLIFERGQLSVILLLSINCVMIIQRGS